MLVYVCRLVMSLCALASLVLDITRALVESALAAALLLLKCQPWRAAKMLVCGRYRPKRRDDKQRARPAPAEDEPALSSAQEDDRAERMADAAGLAKMERDAAEGVTYRDAETVVFIGNSIIVGATELEYAPPQDEAAFGDAASGAAALPRDAVAVPVPGGRAFLWSDTPRPDRVKQGSVGSCWLIASIAATAKNSGAIKGCFPSATSAEELPVGACPVALHDRAGVRRTLPLDTRLFFSSSFSWSGAARRLTGASSRNGDEAELWVPMLEKAMARLKGGSYRNIHGGLPDEALFALTGASIEAFVLKADDGSVLRRLKKAEARGELAVAGVFQSPTTMLLATLLQPVRCVCGMLGVNLCGAVDVCSCLYPFPARRACAILGRGHCFRASLVFVALKRTLVNAADLVAALALAPLNMLTCSLLGECVPHLNGVYASHAYTVLSAPRVHMQCCGVGCGSARLVRLRNPHGVGGREWRGAWADGSCYWWLVSDAEKARVRYSWSDQSFDSRPCACRGRLFESLPCCGNDRAAFGRTAEDDGAFFMSEAQFFDVFDVVYICHSRKGWENKAVRAELRGHSAFFRVTVSATLAPALPIGRHGSHESVRNAAAAYEDVRIVVPSAAAVLGPEAALVTEPEHGVLASFAIVDPYGKSLRVRVAAYDNETHEPVASSQPDNVRDSFAWSFPSRQAVRVAGTNVARLVAGHSYTVWAQWDGALGCGAGRPREPREVSLLVSASTTAPLELSVPDAAPHWPLAWAPVRPTVHGICRSCGRALPSDFAYVLGARYHRECAPSFKIFPWCCERSW